MFSQKVLSQNKIFSKTEINMIIACAIIGLLALVRISVNLISARALSKSKQRINNRKQTNKRKCRRQKIFVDFCACFIFLERGFDFDNDKKGVSEHQSDSQTTFAPAAAIIDG